MCSWIGILSIKMSGQFTLICRFNGLLTNISAVFFIEVDFKINTEMQVI